MNVRNVDVAVIYMGKQIQDKVALTFDTWQFYHCTRNVAGPLHEDNPESPSTY